MNFNSPPFGFGAPRLDWAVQAIQFLDRRYNAIASSGGGGGSGLTIGQSITGGTNNTILFQGATGLLAENANFKYDNNGNVIVGSVFSFKASPYGGAGTNKWLTLGTDGDVTVGDLETALNGTRIRVDPSLNIITFTGNIASSIFQSNALAATTSPSITINNTTASTNAQNQVSPAIYLLGTTWGASSNVTGFRAYSSGVSAARSLFYPVFNIDSTADGSTFINVLKLYSVASGQAATLTTAFTVSGTLTGSGATNLNGGVNISGGTANITTGILLPISTKAGTYSVLVTDYTILADTTSGGFTVTLPNAASNSGQIFNIKKIAAANTLTIATSGGNIDGAANLSVTANNQNTQVQSNGTNYYIL